MTFLITVVFVHWPLYSTSCMRTPCPICNSCRDLAVFIIPKLSCLLSLLNFIFHMFDTARYSNVTMVGSKVRVLLECNFEMVCIHLILLVCSASLTLSQKDHHHLCTVDFPRFHFFTAASAFPLLWLWYCELVRCVKTYAFAKAS